MPPKLLALVTPRDRLAYHPNPQITLPLATDLLPSPALAVSVDGDDDKGQVQRWCTGQMNSLAYLSRQFDVLASPRAPPSTPSEERSFFLTDGGVRSLQPDGTSNTSLKRVKTWSTKSFLFPPPHQSPEQRSKPKRSYSSPADFVTMATLRVRSTTPPSSEISIRSKSKSNVDSLLKRIFFVRVFVALWNTLRAAWSSLAGRTKTIYVTVEDGTDTEGKETEDEAQDEKLVLQSPASPLSPSIPSFPPTPSTSSTSIVYSLHHAERDSLSPSNSKMESETQTPPPTPPSLSALPSGDVSRAGTPPQLPARKTPFHLPKTLVLDLDETLIHSTSRPIFASSSSGSGLLGLGGFGTRNKGAGHMVEVVLGGRSTLYHVYKRPFVDYFLRKVCHPVTSNHVL